MPKQVQRSPELHKNVGIVTLAIDQSNINKQLVYSCGTDESIGVWTIDQDEGLVYDVQNCTNKLHGVLAAYGETFYVGETVEDVITGNKKQAVVKYIKDEFRPSSPILTFTWEITALALSSDGNHLLAGSSDFKVKCIDLDKREQGFQSFDCEGHIVNLSIDPKCTFFAVSSSDGNVQIRTLARESDNFKKPISVFKVSCGFRHITFETSRMQTSWLSSGERIFIPGLGKILVVNCMNWTEEKGLCAPASTHETFSVTAISENDQFLVASTIQGTMAVWLIEGFQLYKTLNVSLDAIVTSLVFNPINDGSVVLAYSKGYLGLVKDATALKTCAKADSPQPDTIVRIGSSMSGSGHDEFGDLEDVETDLGLIKSQYGFAEDGTFNPTAAAMRSNALSNTIGNAPVNFSLNNVMSTPKVDPSTKIKKMKVQKPFGNGSTPTNQGQCYLVWNTFGVIKSFNTPDDSTIEVVFHDVTVHSEIIVDNAATSYVLGDLNNNLVALASYLNADRDSELLVHHITAWDVDSRQWSVKMSEGESVDCLAVGSEFVAVFTDRRFLRVFSAAGTQRNVISLAGSILTMCASVNTLAAVKSTGAVLITEEGEYEHQLTAEMFAVNTSSSSHSIRMQKSVPVALSEASYLKWISFSNVGDLVAMDSQCTVRLFTSDNYWQPIFIGSELIKESESDFIWPIAVMEKPTALFRYIYCKGIKYPLVSKNLVPLTVPWKLPMTNSGTDRSQLESKVIINELMQSALKSHLKEDSSLSALIAQLGQENLKSLVKLFAISCKNGRECRAAELANLTTDLHGIQVLCTYAAKSQRPNLSEKVAAIGRNRMEHESSYASPLVESDGLFQYPSASSPSVFASTGDTQLAPSSKLLPKKMLYTKKSTTNVTSTVSLNKPESKGDDEDDESAVIASNFPRPTASHLNDSVLSDDSFNYFGAPSPSLISDVLVSAKNPFKRTKITETEEKEENIFSSGVDFFEQLTTKRTKLTDTLSTSSNLRNSLDGVKRCSKKQPKLTFNSGELVSETLLKDTINDANSSKNRVTGFDLWCEETKQTFLKCYDGPAEEFQTHMVKQFRMLTSQEKKKWNAAAKSS